MDEDKFKDELLNLLTSIEKQENLDQILDLLLTPQEYEEVITRLQIFKKLQAGDTQRDVSEELDVSIATVTRGSREIQQKPGQIKKLFNILEDLNE